MNWYTLATISLSLGWGASTSWSSWPGPPLIWPRLLKSRSTAKSRTFGTRVVDFMVVRKRMRRIARCLTRLLKCIRSCNGCEIDRRRRSHWWATGYFCRTLHHISTSLPCGIQHLQGRPTGIRKTIPIAAAVLFGQRSTCMGSSSPTRRNASLKVLHQCRHPLLEATHSLCLWLRPPRRCRWRGGSADSIPLPLHPALHCMSRADL
mmetsp:Transcript_36128/g.105725  ORF Transcript_36128/g.105725 Transcript_36128/m.105725 type:complete len:206 (-) Transcript_36128:528-1145(-)